MSPYQCTSTTRPSSPWEGQLIYETDTNRILVYNASAWVMMVAADSPPGMELVKVVDVSSSSTNVTSCFSSTYRVYRIIFDAIKTNGTDPFTLQLLSNTTPATSGYTKQRFYAQGATVGGSYVSSQSSIIAGYTASNVEQSISCDVFDPNATVITKFIFQQVYHDGTNVSYMEQGTASHTTTSAYDGFSLSCGSNSFTGGTIRVYGYRNSI